MRHDGLGCYALFKSSAISFDGATLVGCGGGAASGALLSLAGRAHYCCLEMGLVTTLHHIA